MQCQWTVKIVNVSNVQENTLSSEQLEEARRYHLSRPAGA